MFEGTQLSVLLWDIGRWMGLFGFICLSFLIISGDTARYLDRFFGLDKIIKFQRKFSLFTAIFILLHPVFFILSTGSFFNFLIPDFSAMPLALGIFAFYIFFAVILASHFSKRIPYIGWQYIHILTYILFFISFYHAINWGSSYNLLVTKMVYFSLLALMVIAIVYRTMYKIKGVFGDKFFVREIKKETHDTFTLILKSQQKLNFKPGQFCFLRINKDKLYARHPFTISSTPSDNELHFTIKKYGRFTQTAEKLKKGDEVIVDGPFGNFIIKNNEKDLVFFSGGVGIAPFISIIKDQIANKKAQNITLFYAVKTKKDIIFKEKLDSIKKDWFKKVYILSEEKYNDKFCVDGRMDMSTIQENIKDLNNSLFYICGPEGLKNCIKKDLLKLGVSKKNIVIEDFFW